MASLESSGPGVVTVDVVAARDLVSSGHRFLDVRTEEEFKEGHPEAEDVLNIPYLFVTPEGRVNNPRFTEHVSSAYGLEDRIVVGCRSGARSLSAGTDMLKAGYKHVWNMGGGHLAWVDQGLPVKKPLEEEMKLHLDPKAEKVTKEEKLEVVN
ncbi:thiosulfate sulfurtransferase 18-like [Syzygium oleosum]|uniref:thiosulfate sulfurtransferase 18-like n=1 Tax=Syzygium oleosum TaxID=219896 RepID=UPI0011D24CAA|nr:thiosulfate sulfurtransferase 18-like [Syzygium oleosum]